MILTEQYQLLAQNALDKGVNMAMATESGVYADLPFIQINSLFYEYNIAEELPEVEYRDINGMYTEGSATVKKVVEKLCVLGGDSDVDVVLQRASNINDIRALQTELKAKAIARQFEKDFFAGTGESYKIKGLDKRLFEGLAGTEIKKAFGESAEAIEDLAVMYELMGKVKKPTHLFMSNEMYQKFIITLHKAGLDIATGTDNFGKPTEIFNKAKVVAVDESLIPAGKIYCVNLSKDGIYGITQDGIQTRDLGESHNKPVLRTRIEFACNIVTSIPKCFAVLNTNGAVRTRKK